MKEILGCAQKMGGGGRGEGLDWCTINRGKVHYNTELEFLNNLRGLGTEQE